MSTLAVAAGSPPGPPQTPPDRGLYQFTVEQYERIVELGLLTEEDKVELLDGFLVKKMTRHEPHSFACTVAREAIARLMPAGWYLRVEQPVRIPDRDEPEPDLAIVTGSPRDHLRLGRPPEPGEVSFVLEVADSTLVGDRTVKLRAYARARISVYWLVNLVDRQVEIYTGPESERYGNIQIIGPDQAATVVVDGSAVGQVVVADLLP
jgi:Uma2 family endonuclease